MNTFALMLLVLVGGREETYVLDFGMTRDDCVAAIHDSETRWANMAGVEVSLACEPESN